MAVAQDFVGEDIVRFREVDLILVFLARLLDEAQV